MPRDLILFDGPVGTELTARGVATGLPLWSASAVTEAPDVLARIHADYAEAGATLHTACTFRTQPRMLGPAFAEVTRRAVEIARQSIPRDHRVAGSIAPIADCYRPDLSPGIGSRADHRKMIRALDEASVDVMLCETFPHVEEGLVAVEEALRTGRPTWLALTAGPDATLLTPDAFHRGAERAFALGAECVLVNCVPASACGPYVEALESIGKPFGVYANSGLPNDENGFTSTSAPVALYADTMMGFVARGARVIGGCCGTGPAHIRELQRRYDSTSML